MLCLVLTKGEKIFFQCGYDGKFVSTHAFALYTVASFNFSLYPQTTYTLPIASGISFFVWSV